MSHGYIHTADNHKAWGSGHCGDGSHSKVRTRARLQNHREAQQRLIPAAQLQTVSTKGQRAKIWSAVLAKQEQGERAGVRKLPTFHLAGGYKRTFEHVHLCKEKLITGAVVGVKTAP